MMTTFVLSVGALIVASLALLLPPLLKRDLRGSGTDAAQLSLDVLRDQVAELDQAKTAAGGESALFESERLELERRAIEDAAPSGGATLSARRIGLAAAIAVLVPISAGSLYAYLGSPAVLSPPPPLAGSNHPVTPQQIQEMVARLADRLQNNPQDGEGWLMLARSYTVLARYPEAAAAFGRATELLPPNAMLLADYADVLAMAQGKKFSGAPEQVIARALRVDPNNIKALALSGTAAFERADYPLAVSEWRKILAIVPADSNAAKGIANSIAAAEAKLASAGMPAVVAAAVTSSVSGMVTLDSRLTGQFSPGDTLFVFARRADGPTMPVAMMRRTAGELPLRFTLDDSMSMMPNAKLSGAGTVIVGARISKSGEGRARPGDLEGFSQPVAIGEQSVRLVIANQVP